MPMPNYAPISQTVAFTSVTLNLQLEDVVLHKNQTFSVENAIRIHI